MLVDLKNFTSNNLGSWNKIYTGKDSLYTFIYHATVGGAIKQAMWNDPRAGADDGRFDMMIGFWTSYHVTEAEKRGWNITWNSKYGSKDDGSDTILGLVDIARGFKAIMYCEHGGVQGRFSDVDSLPTDQITGPNSNGSYDYGLMQVNGDTFIKGCAEGSIGLLYSSPFFKNLQGFGKDDSLWQSNVFGNIGAAIGIVMNRAMHNNGVMYGGKNPSLMHWVGFVYGYNPRETGDGKLAYYKCWLNFLTQISPNIKKPSKFPFCPP